jgi:esterase/lipase
MTNPIWFIIISALFVVNISSEFFFYENKEIIKIHSYNKGIDSLYRVTVNGINNAVDLFSTHTSFKIPLYFMVGLCDYNTPFAITEEYYEAINAPVKNIFYFENSGHYMQFVENEKFNKIMMSEILNTKREY